MEESLAPDGHLVDVKGRTYRVVHEIEFGRLALLDRALRDRPLKWVSGVIVLFQGMKIFQFLLMLKKILPTLESSLLDFILSYPLDHTSSRMRLAELREVVCSLVEREGLAEELLVKHQSE